MERMTAGDWSAASTGTGPGVITPDGCAVDFYALRRRARSLRSCTPPLDLRMRRSWNSVPAPAGSLTCWPGWATTWSPSMNRQRCSFTTMRLDDARLRTALGSAGLVFDRYLTDDSQWIRAVPA
jgi:hypothetical protein